MAAIRTKPAPPARRDEPGPRDPRLPASTRRTRLRGVALRAVAGFAVAAIVYLIGRETGAIVIAAVVTVLAVLSACSARIAEWTERVVAVVTHAVGRVLTVVLLGAVQLIVITPAWLVMRLFRYDPLAFGRSADAASLWRAIPGSTDRSLYRRQFTDERAARKPKVARGHLPFVRVRAVIGLVVVLVVVDLAIGSGVDALRRATSGGSGSVQAQALGFPLAPPAAAAEPWVKDLDAELTKVVAHRRFDPYLGWRMPDVRSPYLNISNGVRASYEPPLTASERPITIAFFGGSAMWGMFQRDEHTIASEVARLAQADGVPVRVTNYAEGAYVNWQELTLFQQVLAGGQRPDIAVFYDGVNDVMSQFRVGPYVTPSNLEATDMERALELGHQAETNTNKESLFSRIMHSWSDTSAVNRVVRAARQYVTGHGKQATPFPSFLQTTGEGDKAVSVGRSAALVYGRGVDQASRLAASYGVEPAFFWQPSLFTKRPGPGDAQATGIWGENPVAWRTATNVARSALPPSVVDLSHALDGATTPVMYDFVHTNEAGAELVARAIYAQLRPRLLELERARPG